MEGNDQEKVYSRALRAAFLAPQNAAPAKPQKESTKARRLRRAEEAKQAAAAAADAKANEEKGEHDLKEGDEVRAPGIYGVSHF